MIDGRPSPTDYHTKFNKTGEKQHVDSLVSKVDVSGWQYYSG
jgi:hypothetical protein